MDIRDIKEEVPVVKDSLLEIYFLQGQLIEHYINIEGLPRAPLNLNLKGHQSLIKDFISRVIEELGEAWESYRTMMDMFHKGIDREEMIPFLQNFNEELGDAMHFHMELMIYSDIKPGDLYDLYGDGVVNLLHTGALQNAAEFPDYPSYMVISEQGLRDEFLRGGRKLGKKHEAAMERLLWRTTYYYMIARNTLKNKPWKQTQLLTDSNLYKSYVIQANQALFTFFNYAGLTPRSLFTIYYKKNLINQFRIKSKY